MKDTRLSNRIPLNRVPKKESSDPSMANAEGNFKDDFDIMDEIIRQRKLPKEDKNVKK